MILSLLKRAVKAALHAATEEWALEIGLPRAALQQLRSKRLALTAQAESRADADAAAALDVDDDEPCPEGGTTTSMPAVLPMPTVARHSGPVTTAPCPDPSDESAFMDWVQRQREGHVGWADIATTTTLSGHAVSEDALRRRYHRWRERTAPTDNGPDSVA